MPSMSDATPVAPAEPTPPAAPTAPAVSATPVESTSLVPVVVPPTLPVAERVALGQAAPGIEELFLFAREAELRVRTLRMVIEERLETARGEERCATRSGSVTPVRRASPRGATRDRSRATTKSGSSGTTP